MKHWAEIAIGGDDVYIGGGGLSILVAVLAGLIGVALMVTEKRWKAVAFIISGYICYAIAGYAVFSIPTEHLRMAFAIPFAITVPAILLSGLLIWDAATDEEAFNRRWERFISRKVDHAKRRKGIMQLLFGFTVWFYWLFNFNQSNIEMAIVFALYIYPTIFGLKNFFAEEVQEKQAQMK